MPASSILAWLAIGLAVGAIGKFIARRRNPAGMIASILIAIAGALLAGFVAQTMQWTAIGSWQNFAASAVGATMTVSIYLLIAQSVS